MQLSRPHYFGIQIKKARRTAGLTQEQLAHAIGMAQTDVWKMETGKRQRINAEILEKISRATNYPIQFFFERGEAKNKGRPKNYEKKLQEIISQLEEISEPATQYGRSAKSLPLVLTFDSIFKKEFCAQVHIPQILLPNDFDGFILKMPYLIEGELIKLDDFLLINESDRGNVGDLVLFQKRNGVIEVDRVTEKMRKQADSYNFIGRVVYHFRSL